MVWTIADCICSYRSLSDKCLEKRTATTFSTILDTTHRFDTGRQFLTSFASSVVVFSNRVTRAFLKAEGKTPVAIDMFTISAMTGARLDKLF